MRRGRGCESFRFAGDVTDFAISKFVLLKHLSESIIKYAEGKHRMGEEF